MGMNTVLMLLNDHAHRWPDEIRRAMQHWEPGGSDRFSVDFGYGQVLSVAHADYDQITTVGGNTGSVLSPIKPATHSQLEDLAMILRGHGYTVRAPGKSKGDGPVPWGYAAPRPTPARKEVGDGNDEG